MVLGFLSLQENTSLRFTGLRDSTSLQSRCGKAVCDEAGMEGRGVAAFAVFTRILTLILQALFNALIPDHVPDAFAPPRAGEPRVLDPAVELLFGGLSHWDAEHFLFIAERGYLYEHNFAFFPLLPLSLRAVAAGVLWPLGGWLSVRGRLLLAVVLLNSLLFALGALGLYGLGRAVTQDRRLAYCSSLLYCLTPANVFMAAGYSESMFAGLAFGGMWLLEGGRTPGGCLALALATGARSNGVVNVGFLLYLQLRRWVSQTRAVSGSPLGLGRCLRYAWISVCRLSTVTLGAAVILLPFVLFQYYGYRMFCTPALGPGDIPPELLELAELKGYQVPDVTKDPPAWCLEPYPVLYSHIQDVYWNVGFLRYYQLKQLPNFLLALPAAVLTAAAAWGYLTADPRLCLRLGLPGDRPAEGGRGGERDKPAAGFHSPRVFVYLVHATALLLFGALCMHVQVLTRFLGSSSPVLYWYGAHLLVAREPLLAGDGAWRPGACGGLLGNPLARLLRAWRSCSPVTRCVLGYFTSYWLLGLVLHCNSLPWT